MTISPAGIALISAAERCLLRAYPDEGGIWTIGFGTTHYPDGQPVKMGDTCTVEQAQEWLSHDVTKTEVGVSEAVRVPLSQNQFDALVSLAYNIGLGAFRGSTLLKLLNAGCAELAAKQFTLWNKVDGKPSSGLLRRRVMEQARFGMVDEVAI